MEIILFLNFATLKCLEGTRKQREADCTHVLRNASKLAMGLLSAINNNDSCIETIKVLLWGFTKTKVYVQQ